MTHDTVPATKADITALMDSIGKLYDANERWKDEIIRHFDVVVEDIRHDLTGAHRDAFESLKEGQAHHERRITTLERHLGTA